MEDIIFRFCEQVFKMMGALLFLGLATSVLLDIQKKAFESKRRGLISLVSINRQLFDQPSPKISKNKKLKAEFKPAKRSI